MPIFSIYVPKHIKEKYPHIHENLLKNTERLTTAFDVYETLQDVLNSRFEHTERVDEKSRGISLFRPIPEKRSCFDADIPEHYCPCYASESVDLKSKRVQIMANALVSKLNKLIERYSDRCSVLVLKSVVKASIVNRTSNEINLWKNASRLEVIFTVALKTINIYLLLKHHPVMLNLKQQYTM
jgi:hypothetical protein